MWERTWWGRTRHGAKPADTKKEYGRAMRWCHSPLWGEIRVSRYIQEKLIFPSQSELRSVEPNKYIKLNRIFYLIPIIAFCATLFSSPLSYTYDRAATVGPQMIKNKSWSKLLPKPWMYFPSGVLLRLNNTCLTSPHVQVDSLKMQQNRNVDT